MRSLKRESKNFETVYFGSQSDIDGNSNRDQTNATSALCRVKSDSRHSDLLPQLGEYNRYT